MRKLALQRIVPENKKGYQSVKTYIPNDTLMGLTTKTSRNTYKIKLKETLPTTLTFSLYASMNLQPSNSSLNRPINIQH